MGLEDHNENVISWDKIFVRHSIHYFNREVISISKSGVYIFPYYYLNVKDSIHFKALSKNNYQVYNSYLKEINQNEHNEYNFKKLLAEFDLSKMGEIEINRIIDSYYVCDGLHRLSIILFKNLFPMGIPKKYFKIIRKDKNRIKNFFKNKLKKLILRTISFAYDD